jgi:hypothetical protein
VVFENRRAIVSAGANLVRAPGLSVALPILADLWMSIGAFGVAVESAIKIGSRHEIQMEGP